MNFNELLMSYFPVYRDFCGQASWDLWSRRPGCSCPTWFQVYPRRWSVWIFCFGGIFHFSLFSRFVWVCWFLRLKCGQPVCRGWIRGFRFVSSGVEDQEDEWLTSFQCFGFEGRVQMSRRGTFWSGLDWVIESFDTLKLLGIITQFSLMTNSFIGKTMSRILSQIHKW